MKLQEYMNDAISKASEMVEHENTVHFLNAMSSSIIDACDSINSNDEFSLVILVLNTFSRIAGQVSCVAEGNDRKVVESLCRVYNLPTDLD